MGNKLTPEQIEKIKECKSLEELKKLVQTESIELTEEELNEVAGGARPIVGEGPLFIGEVISPSDPQYQKLFN